MYWSVLPVVPQCFHFLLQIISVWQRDIWSWKILRCWHGLHGGFGDSLTISLIFTWQPVLWVKPAVWKHSWLETSQLVCYSGLVTYWKSNSNKSLQGSSLHLSWQPGPPSAPMPGHSSQHPQRCWIAPYECLSHSGGCQEVGYSLCQQKLLVLSRSKHGRVMSSAREPWPADVQRIKTHLCTLL